MKNLAKYSSVTENGLDERLVRYYIKTLIYSGLYTFGKYVNCIILFYKADNSNAVR